MLRSIFTQTTECLRSSTKTTGSCDRKRLPNRLTAFLDEREPYKASLAGVAVESTFNWYWLVDGLIKNGYEAKLVNTSAVQQYSGLKHSDDEYDAWWLAHMMRLSILPTGHIYPRDERAVRDLLRKRTTLVQQRTANETLRKP